ncbi:hypothetical protein J2S78_000109 [Salibacterium salarium]|uniref:CehA/McbA family metallohydrolase n=1 Tax=Salibacterium salarium TaxID=284579 RepID=UPI00278B0B3E|nr:CehA/McbA family metallohydrolase [Salibacterium salarium]MDQ0297701.1 hypothetical protein [Salibacterium salarium]
MKTTDYEVTIATHSGKIDHNQPTWEMTFQVPPYIGELQLRIAIGAGNSRLAFQIFDPIRNRGFFVPWIPQEWSNDITLMLNENEAERGLEKGPIVAGEWTVHVSGIPVRDTSSFDMEIIGVCQHPEFDYSWYKGDLHSHTNHTDGALSLDGLIHTAKSAELDFLFLTDHNTISGFRLNQNEDECLVMRGVEITTPLGHANLFGIKTMIDWRVDGENRTFDEVAKETRQQEGLFSINHPFTSHLSWKQWNMDLDLVDCLEIWNNPGHPANEQATEEALQKWDELLNEGYRHTGIGGSDSVHYGFKGEHRPGFPSTYVLADGLSEHHILKALKERHVVVSKGPFVGSVLYYEEKPFQVGDIVPVNEEEENVIIETSTAFHESKVLQCVKNAELYEETEVSFGNESVLQVRVKKGDWIRIQLRDAEGKLCAFANPFFIE